MSFEFNIMHLDCLNIILSQIKSLFMGMCLGDCCYSSLLQISIFILLSTACTACFTKKSPWSVFFRGEMSVICHKITVKCR